MVVLTQLLGIGRTGHIGFNEPGSAISSRTRLVWLDPITRKDLQVALANSLCKTGHDNGHTGYN